MRHEDRGLVHDLNVKSQEIRGRFFLPILRRLDLLGVSGNMITNFRLILGFVFFYLFFKSMYFGAILSLLTLILDAVDGPLARFQDKASDRGKFLDVFVDRIVYSFIICLFFWLNTNPYLVVYHLLIIPLVYVLASVKNGETLKSDWIIKLRPKLTYVIVLPALAFYAFVFFAFDFLDFSLWISNALATGLSIYYYIYIQVRWHKGK